MSRGSKSKPPQKANVPRANDMLNLKEREPKNYVKGNFNAAVYDMKPKELAVADNKYAHRNQGKVPSYINKYNAQREDKIKEKAY
jgi:hypothetical protein